MNDPSLSQASQRIAAFNHRITFVVMGLIHMLSGLICDERGLLLSGQFMLAYYAILALNKPGKIKPEKDKPA